jgi:hypothetical protein
MDTPYPHSPGPVLTIMENMVGYNGYNQWKCIAQNTVELTEFIELEISFTVREFIIGIVYTPTVFILVENVCDK